MDQVTDQLWIGTLKDVELQSTSRFDAIISVCQDEAADNISCTYHHYPLSDGPPPEHARNPGKFEYRLFEDAVESTVEHVSNGDTVLVHCHAGKSRSAMTIAAALNQLNGLHFTEAYETVHETRSGGIQPSDGLWDFARQYCE